MAATVVTSPYSSILDLTGAGLSLGTVYIGAPNQDPQTNPQAVFWDQALTIPATQPLQVSAGYIMRAGSPSAVFTSGDYSIRALDHNGAQVFYRATSIIIPPVLPAARTLLTANTDFFVSTIGNDATGTGSAGSPWQSIQKAFNVLASSYDLAGFVATIQVGAGTFGGAALGTPIPGATNGAGSVVVNGAGVALTTVRGAAGNAAFGASFGAGFTVLNMTLGGTGAFGLSTNSGGVIGFGSVVFAAVTQAHINPGGPSTILCAGNYAISGGAPAHFFAFGSGAVLGHFGGPYVCTLTGTPAFTAAFAQAGDNAFISAQATWLSFIGAATGPRYLALNNATIDTFGSGAAYFPGSAAGSFTNNGVYA